MPGSRRRSLLKSAVSHSFDLVEHDWRLSLLSLPGRARNVPPIRPFGPLDPCDSSYHHDI
jgi:hypothetical protein